MVTKLMPLDILFLALPRADASAACLLIGRHFPRVLGVVVLAGLTACGAPEQAATQATRTIEVAKTVVPQPDAILAAPTAIQNASQAPATVAPATSGDWPAYRADKAGYSVAYPGGWAVQEETDSGVIVTTFAPSGGTPGITVSMQVTDTELAEPLDLPAADAASRWGSAVSMGCGVLMSSCCACRRRRAARVKAISSQAPMRRSIKPCISASWIASG